MLQEVKNLYEFGEFRLDPKERILLRGEQPVELTPKGFELLSFLVENHGRLLGKNELMSKIWADSYVEDSNLTFNIRQLRKILDDDAHSPKYIKTVRQHGYRFIADVKQIQTEDKPRVENQPAVVTESEENKSEIEVPAQTEFPGKTAIAEQPLSPPKTKSFLKPLIFVACGILLVSAVVIGSWYAGNKTGEPNAPVLSAPFGLEKLTKNGRAVHAVLSPDGENVVYSNGMGTDKESVWLRQLDNGNNIEIIPPSDDLYFGFSFSPDGNTIYFVRTPRLTGELPAVYRVSIFGGIPQKIINDTEGWTSISPDGTKISFVRRHRRNQTDYSLWIADSADGKNERQLVARQFPFRIGDNEFAPDGKSIAFAVGQSENSANEFGLAEVDVETGAERELSKEKFFNIKSLMWLPDKTGWLITASRIHTRNIRIWQVSARTGEAVPISKDSETYGKLSPDKKATKIISTQIEPDFDGQLINLENPSDKRELAGASSISFAPDAKIYFSSGVSGNEEIWSVNADGTGKRQLTNTEADESLPIAVPDGKTVIFISNRSGAAHIWRMNADGSNQTQVTNKEGGYPVFVSPDGEWIYYHHGINRTLWRVSLKTGEEQMALNKAKAHFAVSPDGTQVAYSERQGDERILTIASLADGQTIKTFRLADKNLILQHIAWLSDRKHLAYISINRDYSNHILWLQPLDADAPRQIAVLGDKEISGFTLAVSPDGKTLGFTQGEWLHNVVLLKGLR